MDKQQISNNILRQFESGDSLQKAKRVPEGYIYTRKDGRQFRMANGKYVYYNPNKVTAHNIQEHHIEKPKNIDFKPLLNQNEGINNNRTLVNDSGLKENVHTKGYKKEISQPATKNESKSDQIRRLHQEGKSKKEIAEITGAHYSQVHQVVSKVVPKQKEEEKPIQTLVNQQDVNKIQQAGEVMKENKMFNIANYVFSEDSPIDSLRRIVKNADYMRQYMEIPSHKSAYNSKVYELAYNEAKNILNEKLKKNKKSIFNLLPISRSLDDMGGYSFNKLTKNANIDISIGMFDKPMPNEIETVKNITIRRLSHDNNNDLDLVGRIDENVVLYANFRSQGYSEKEALKKVKKSI